MRKIIKLGMYGEDVKDIQKCLHLIPDGIFGEITEEAVKDFQMRNGLWVDGIVGPETMKALEIYPTNKRYINKIIIHCTATPEGENYKLEQVRGWHLDRGFSDIGYHYYIDLNGNVFKGRPIEQAGAHCKGQNSHSIGICYCGGCQPRTVKDWQKKPKDTRTDDQKRALRDLVAQLLKQYPGASVHGHYEFAEKECPSFKICDL